nr:copper-binding protein [uncultured Noviherbaspirillum sp.]
MRNTLFAAALMLAFAPAVHAQPAAADEMSAGEVRKVDKAAGKMTIRHGPLKNLGMDAMTMVFRVQDPAMLDQVKAGDRIGFVAGQAGGQLTVIQLKKQE